MFQTIGPPVDQPPAPLGEAEEHVTRRVPVVAPSTTAGEMRALLGGASFDTVAAVAVVEDERLVGLVSIDVVVRAPAEEIGRAHV